MTLSLSELEAAADTMGGAHLQSLSSVAERVLHVSEVFGNVSLSYGRTRRNLVSGQGSRAQRFRDAFADCVDALHVCRCRGLRAAVGHGFGLGLCESNRESSREATIPHDAAAGQLPAPIALTHAIARQGSRLAVPVERKISERRDTSANPWWIAGGGAP